MSKPKHCFAFLDASDLPVPDLAGTVAHRVIPIAERHVTLLVNLQSSKPEIALKTLNQVLSHTPPITLVPTTAFLSPVSRMCQQQHADIRCLNVRYDAPGVALLRSNFANALAQEGNTTYLGEY